MLCVGCARSHGPSESANPGGDAATDGDAGERLPPTPLAPGCTRAQVAIANLDSLDLLFVIDDSESMREEQAWLRAGLHNLVTVLTTGDLNGDGVQDQPPVHDLHIGVVSADLGAGGLTGVPSCAGRGDDAVLQHAGDPALAGCTSDYPSFLRYVEGEVQPGEAAIDLGCIAALGTGGCAVEQPLGAALRALSTDTSGSFAGAADRQSALGIVIVSDEDDCSVQNPDAFAADSNPADAPAPNLRCFDRADALLDPTQTASALSQLRAGRGDLVFLGAIVGVPPDLLDQVATGDLDIDDPVALAWHYDAILNDPRMQQAVDPDSTLEGGGALLPSCAIDLDLDHESDSRAYPPRRIVEVVKQFGAQGTLASICNPDSSAVLKPMLDAIGKRLQSVCSPDALPRDASGLVPGCEMRWTLPLSTEDGVAPTRCSQRPWLEFVGETDDGAEICSVRQLPLVDGSIAADAGWFFDPSGGPNCPQGKARAAFSAEAAPPTGVSVDVVCCK
jgi:hypothetical protein